MRLRFLERYVHVVPEEPGIFCLWHRAHLVYVGRTAPRTNLRAELNHALTMAMAEDMSCTHFSYEVTAQPKTRAAEQLRECLEGVPGDGLAVVDREVAKRFDEVALPGPGRTAHHQHLGPVDPLERS